MSFNRIGTTGPTRYQVDGRIVRFDPFTELRPGETMTFRIRAKADRPVRSTTLQVQVTSDRMTVPLLESETTEILQPEGNP